MEKCYCSLCSPFLIKKFADVVETVFVVSGGNFRRFFPKVLRFLFFRNLNKVFGVSPNIFLQDCQNCFFCVQRTFMGQRFFQINKTVLFPSLLNFEQNVFVFIQKVSENIVKIAILMSRESFWGFFSGNFVLVLFCGIWSKTVWAFLGKPLIGSSKWNSVCRD